MEVNATSKQGYELSICVHVHVSPSALRPLKVCIITTAHAHHFFTSSDQLEHRQRALFFSSVAEVEVHYVSVKHHLTLPPQRKQEGPGTSVGLFSSVRGSQTNTYFPAKELTESTQAAAQKSQKSPAGELFHPCPPQTRLSCLRSLPAPKQLTPPLQLCRAETAGVERHGCVSINTLSCVRRLLPSISSALMSQTCLHISAPLLLTVCPFPSFLRLLPLHYSCFFLWPLPPLLSLFSPT